MEVRDLDHAMELLTAQIAECKAEALAGTLMNVFLLQWIMHRDPNPTEMFDTLAEAIDPAVDGLDFVITDGHPPEEQDAANNERVREQVRQRCHLILQNSYRLREGRK